VGLERVFAHFVDEPRLVAGADLETAVASEYLVHTSRDRG
jgi:hypothetical protein